MAQLSKLDEKEQVKGVMKEEVVITGPCLHNFQREEKSRWFLLLTCCLFSLLQGAMV